MPDSPLSASPYEILGVSATASADELRKAYRRMLRETHPDTGGNRARFDAVQRAWERIGTPASRAAYDSGSTRDASREQHEPFAPQGPRPRKDTRPLARSHGHPGGWRRERYLTLMREWAGRGVNLDDPYDPALVRTAPRDIRHLLADALAEEATARAVSTLGIAYTIWHDVSTELGHPEQKIDHIVLGPTGLFAVLSEDWGAPIKVKRGELASEGLLPGEKPMQSLERRARLLTKAAKVKFTGLAIVVPDDAIGSSTVGVGSSRGAAELVVQRSYLPGLLRSGVPGTELAGGVEIFDIRERLQRVIRFV